MRKRVAVLISGRGSNMSALIEAANAPDFPAEIALVLSSNPDAPGLERAVAEGIATAIVPHRGFSSREDFDRAMHDILLAAGIEIICLAGFMRLLSPWFCETWAGRMINVHPALLPSFKGLDTHARALATGVRLHGATVHYVVPEMDAGAIIAQAAVPVLFSDTEEALAARVLAQEHRIYPMALRLIATGVITLVNGRAVSSLDQPAIGALISPIF